LLTKAHKHAKIEATLQKDPAIFLAKWGSVILYPRPHQQANTTPAAIGELGSVNGTLQKTDMLASAKGILDLFSPLAGKGNVVSVQVPLIEVRTSFELDINIQFSTSMKKNSGL
jgi:hypothetical protein